MVFFVRKKLYSPVRKKASKICRKKTPERPEGSLEGSKNVGRPQLTTSLL
jgi:hypothetical protein